MYIERVPNRNSPPAILVRSSHREGEKIVKKTLANLSGLPEDIIAIVDLAIKGKNMVAADSAFKILRNQPHGHVEAILGVMKQLQLDKTLSTTPCRERNLSLALIASRLIFPSSKRASVKLADSTTLAEELDVSNVTEKELYEAMDWLLERQTRIEAKLASKHLLAEEGQGHTLVLYDISSSSYYGEHCPLVQRGYSRDDAKLPQIVYGVVTNKEGCPISVDVYEGNTADSATVADQVEKVQKCFKIDKVVLVGDRGMLTSTQIDKLKGQEGLGWVSALRSSQIRKVLAEPNHQLGLFDESNLVEIESEEFPGERLVMCLNPVLRDRRRYEREKLLKKTEEGLEKIAREAQRRKKKPLSEVELGDKSGRILDKYKMRKHFEVKIEEGRMEYRRMEASIREEEKLDGIYVLRTSEPSTELSGPEVVRTYKNLSRVEEAFRCLKGIDLSIRPIHHHLEKRVRAHVFVCLLSYYVEWHMRKALRSVLNEEENPVPRENPVQPAKVSEETQRKKSQGKNAKGWPVYDWKSLIMELGTCCRNTCEVVTGKFKGIFKLQTEPTPFQTHVLELLGLKK
jgi:transposase